MVLYKATKEIKLDKFQKKLTILTHREIQWIFVQQKEPKKG